MREWMTAMADAEETGTARKPRKVIRFNEKGLFACEGLGEIEVYRIILRKRSRTVKSSYTKHS